MLYTENYHKNVKNIILKTIDTGTRRLVSSKLRFKLLKNKKFYILVYTGRLLSKGRI